MNLKLFNSRVYKYLKIKESIDKTFLVCQNKYFNNNYFK